MPFNEYIRDLIGERRVRDVAEAIGVNRTAVYAWMAGEKLPESQHLTALLVALDRPDDREAWGAWLAAKGIPAAAAASGAA